MYMDLRKLACLACCSMLHHAFMLEAHHGTIVKDAGGGAAA